MSDCLQSAEYFALLGAAQLNTGQLTAALESLERALLVDPQHGAAAVDYAQALYNAGQLFPALEINQQLLARTDLPPDLATQLQQRQTQWQAQTVRHGFAAEFTAGYDDNLNGAPSRGEFTLTLSGESVTLTLDDDSRPVNGGFSNLRLGGYFQRITPARSHDLVFALRNRRSGHDESELVQFDWRYAQGLQLRRARWEFMAGTSHLLFGGSPLYSVSEGGARYDFRSNGCHPFVEAVLQHQIYHGQGFMAGLESGAAAGWSCQLGSGEPEWSVDIGPLSNHAMKDNRPGGDRGGWRARFAWQAPLAGGLLNLQAGYAQLDDDSGYSDLLANGAPRQIDSRYVRLQYRRELGSDLALVASLSHQGQGSNLAPFQNRGTSADIGVSLAF